jgi:hypothetical protein
MKAYRMLPSQIKKTNDDLWELILGFLPSFVENEKLEALIDVNLSRLSEFGL